MFRYAVVLTSHFGKSDLLTYLLTYLLTQVTTLRLLVYTKRKISAIADMSDMGVYQSATGYDSGKRVFSMNLFINLSLVTIVLKHHY